MPPDFDLSDPDAVAYCPSCGSGYTARARRCEPCDVALVPRVEIAAAAGPAPGPVAEASDAAEETRVLWRTADPAMAGLLGLELEQAAVPYWTREAPGDFVGGLAAVPSVVEIRVPERYFDEALAALRRVEERGSSGAADDLTTDLTS
jgi:hypothetical protein